ncbi:hypothetical protein K4K56_012644 [Colletotrichum sp. SAR 10_98]|nr:hypothetical protein K4K56_012644 [Colletotrichum sp. SAR 10_98]
MSSGTNATPYTIPYTGAPGKQVAEGIVPASSQQPVPVAQPAAPQDMIAQPAYRRPSAVEAPVSPDMAYSMGGSVAQGGGVGAVHTNNPNSGVRRSSVIATAPVGPSDNIPGRFASAAAGSGGIAIIHPQHTGAKNIHTSQQTGKEVAQTPEQYQRPSAFGMDGSFDDPDILNSPTPSRRSRSASPMLARELQAARLEAQTARREIQRMAHAYNIVQQANLNFQQANVALQQHCLFYQSNAEFHYQNYCVAQSQTQNLLNTSRHLQDVVYLLDNSVYYSDPVFHDALPKCVLSQVDEVRGDWVADEFAAAYA